jgi:hypothetical protein
MTFEKTTIILKPEKAKNQEVRNYENRSKILTLSAKRQKVKDQTRNPGYENYYLRKLNS